MIHTKTYEAPMINDREILRYAGTREATDEVISLMHETVEEATGVLTYKVCYGEFAVTRREDGIDFGFSSVSSSALAKNLEECEKVIIFSATVGIGIDRLIAKYGVRSPSKALLLQAFGAERIESLCDLFTRDIASQYGENNLAPRFSPGYGDLPLEFQTEIFRVLDCPRRIGLTLNKSLLMSPSKSVTAIIGIKK